MKKPSELTIEEWNQLYPENTMKQIATILGCGETTIHKWITRSGIQVTKKNRVERSAEHRKKISDALTGREGIKNGITKVCMFCQKSFYVTKAREKTANFCSVQCRASSIQKNWISENNPRYIRDISREKICEGCGKSFLHLPPKPITSFMLQKYCTKSCADKFGFRYRGENHINYKGVLARKRSRNNQDSRWSIKVIQRDGHKCQKCGVDGEIATLQAHHIHPYEIYPEKRNDISNGITLCSKCHWEVHDTLDKNFIVTDKNAKSKKRLLLDGVIKEEKVFGKDARKWHGNCFWCGNKIVKRLSDVTGRTSAFCNRSCSSKHRRAFGSFRPTNKELIPQTAKRPLDKPLI